jgi:hypothetical protein
MSLGLANYNASEHRWDDRVGRAPSLGQKRA